jgi:hypothetical protein
VLFRWVSRSEFPFTSATGAAKRFESYENLRLRNVRWLGRGELFGEIGVHAGNLCGAAPADNAISGAARALAASSCIRLGGNGMLARPDGKESVDLRDSAASRSGAPISVSARRSHLKAVLISISGQ